MITYERPKWVLPGQQWSVGQTQLQYEQAGGKLAPGVSSVISAPITPYTPPAPIYAPTTPVVAPELAAFNQQMVNAPAPNVASPGYTGYGAAGAQGYYVKDSIAYDKATNRRIVELGKGWQFAEPAPTPANIQQAGSQVGQTYTVKSGDTLSKIAQRLGVSVGQISGYRSGNPNLIYPGENLTIGGTSATQGGTPSGQLTPEQTKYFQDQIAKIQTGITSIQNPIPVSGQGAAPTLPPQPSGAITQSYYSSAAQDLINTTKALNAARDKQIADTRAQQATVRQQLDEIRTLQAEGIFQQGEAVADKKQRILDLLTEEEARFDKNYNIVQGLAGQLQTLLTNGNDLITQQKAQTGLSSIMTPRINQTISDVTAQAGVIKATISAYNGQMNQAQSQLINASNVITSAFSDQINYYKTLFDFYESQAGDENARLIVLTKDQKDFLNAKIATLENDRKITQTNVENLKKAFTDKDTALAYASAGVTLNDSPEAINKKLGVYYQTKAIEDNNNTMAKDGWSPLLPGQSAPAGSTLTQTVVNGTVKNWYKKATGETTDSVVDIRQQRKDLANLLAQVATYPSREQATTELNAYKASIITRIGQEGFNKIQQEVDRKFPPPEEEPITEAKPSIFETVTGAVSGFFNRLFQK